MANGILEHRDWQPEGMQAFVARHLRALGLMAPGFDQVDGEVKATVNHGRWVVDCPAGCGGAMVVDEQEPYFLCVDCGNRNNAGLWYHVVFPRTKRAIESVLMKRPAPHWRYASSRNWTPKETLADLRKENRDRGLPEDEGG